MWRFSQCVSVAIYFPRGAAAMELKHACGPTGGAWGGANEHVISIIFISISLLIRFPRVSGKYFVFFGSVCNSGWPPLAQIF